ncbi:MAG: hypothetical protein AVDCRST_MAG10-1990 [uncultured Acidimicrobiales bacterium]|uniref:Uncharacterized protein n=1 Tax=uncultured Acidimicrobiales bacterium TaxID=310071 RepID=A0A6J4ICL3_9ACTN|nr:MAG: hypothetical protein AVDCRST_MAG10-1990 [uncultured Acidimicrobiales bacterium]
MAQEQALIVDTGRGEGGWMSASPGSAKIASAINSAARAVVW